MLGEMQNYTATLETSLAVSYKTNILFSYHPEVAFTGFIYSNGVLKDVHTKFVHACWYVISTPFIIAKLYKQPRCSSVGGWINT